MKCLRSRGVLASFGEASGDPDPVPPRSLGAAGSIWLSHPRLSDYTASRAELMQTMDDLFAVVLAGKVKIEISHAYPLRDAPRAHADIEARRTTGSIVLIA
jgi:NADPH2:quinone reductase